MNGLDNHLDDHGLMLRVVRDQDVGFSRSVSRDEQAIASLLNRGDLMISRAELV
jgi:hypothetical protein